MAATVSINAWRLVNDALDRGGGLPPPSSADWLVGTGIALGMIDTVPPCGHIADARAALRDDGDLRT